MSDRLKIPCCILLAGSLALPALGDPAVVDRPTITTGGAKALIVKAEAKARSLQKNASPSIRTSGRAYTHSSDFGSVIRDSYKVSFSRIATSACGCTIP
jgi:hypothetical protein